MMKLFILLSVLLKLNSSIAKVCEKNPVNSADQINLECATSKQIVCKEFYSLMSDSFVSENQRQFENNSNNLTQAVLSCSPAALYVSVKVYNGLNQATKRKLVDLIPELSKKVGLRALPYISGLGVAATAYSFFDFLADSIETDRNCFLDKDGKKQNLLLLKQQNDFIVNKISHLVRAEELNYIKFPLVYLSPSYIDNANCSTIRDLSINQKRKLDFVLGPLLASGKLPADPRSTNLSSTDGVEYLSDEDLSLSTYFLNHIECVSPMKRAEILCAIGNGLIGLSRLKTFLNPNEKLAVSEIARKQRTEVQRIRATLMLWTAEKKVIQEAATNGTLKVNLGGIGEVKGAVNINNLQDPRHVNINIPHLIKGDMRKMPYLDNSSVQELYCMACPGSREFFDEVTKEALRIVKNGGTFRITSNSSASPWLSALEKAGFQIVNKTDKSVLARKP